MDYLFWQNIILGLTGIAVCIYTAATHRHNRTVSQQLNLLERQFGWELTQIEPVLIPRMIIYSPDLLTIDFMNEGKSANDITISSSFHAGVTVELASGMKNMHSDSSYYKIHFSGWNEKDPFGFIMEYRDIFGARRTKKIELTRGQIIKLGMEQHNGRFELLKE